jgi:four helix bundle protein
MQIKSATELDVYKMAFDVAMDVLHLSRGWPKEERYSLTDQIRRSSRSVCANLREAWAKRRYPSHFVSKLTDADAENAETGTWLDFARACGYLEESLYAELSERNAHVGRMLGTMILHPESFVTKVS